ncbi:unnamed protein product, partial [Ectocarpus fasciculatus]
LSPRRPALALFLSAFICTIHVASDLLSAAHLYTTTISMIMGSKTSRSGTTRAALFLSACALLLRPAAPFLRLAPSGAADPAGAAHRQRHVRPVSARPQQARVLVSMMTEVDADIPGIADSRLAGWRVGSKEAAATAAAEDTAAVDSDADSEGGAGGSGEPGCGDVVEYPLTDLVKSESTDGREKGVAVIVSINKLRNDAWKLPEDILDKAELQVLCPDLDSEEEGVWMADELETCAFAKLGEMKVASSSFNGAMDKWKRWTISDELSEGCGARDAEWEYDML